MKAYTFIILSFFSSQVFSQSISQIRTENFLREIQQLDQTMATTLPPPHCLTKDSSQNSLLSQNLYNQCARDLCGSPSQNKTIWISDDSIKRHLSFFKRLKTKKINETIENIYKIELKTKLAQLEEIKKNLNTPENLINELVYTQKLALDKLIFDPYIKKEINLDADFDKKVVLTPTPPSSASAAFKIALQNYAQSATEAIYFSPEIITNNTLSDDDLKKVVGLIRDRISPHVEGIKHNGFLGKDSARASLEKAKTLDKLSRPELEALRGELVLQSQYISANDGPRFSLEPECRASTCNNVYNEFFGTEVTKNKISAYEDILKKPSTFNQAVNSCKAALYLLEVEAANSKEAQKVFELAKKDLKDNYISQFSRESQAKLVDFVDNKLAVSAINAKNIGSQLNAIQTFQEAADKYLSDKSKENKSSKSAPAESFILLNFLFDQLSPLDGAHPCQGTSYSLSAWDSYLPVTRLNQVLEPEALKLVESTIGTKDHVFLSDFTCNHPDHGKHITAHEIGHALSSFFKHNKLSVSSAKRYNDARACTTQTQPTAPVSKETFRATFEGDSLFTEEDMADIVAFKTYQGDDKLYSCIFLKPSLTSDNYIDLSFDAAAGDDHTHGFVRVLFEAVNKDVSLPESCNQLINNVQPQIRLNKCI